MTCCQEPVESQEALQWPLNCIIWYNFISLVYIQLLKGDFLLGTGEAYFTDADLDCSDFPFLLIAQINQDSWSLSQLLLKVDPASYILRVDSFWLNKPRWDSWMLSVLSSSHVTIRALFLNMCCFLVFACTSPETFC